MKKKSAESLKFAPYFNIQYMKKNVIIFGLIIGAIITGHMFYMVNLFYTNPDFKSNDFLGYAMLILVFSPIFVAVLNYRNRYNNGEVSFGKAFRIGLYISLIASTIYVGVWLVDYYLFVPDFIDKYISRVLKQAQQNGATATQLEEKAKEMANFKEMYKNPLFIILTTFMEVFPIGLVISLIAALILKRKKKDMSMEM